MKNKATPMSRRGQESDWALKKVLAERCRINETVYDCEARLLRNEHARSVRILKRFQKAGRESVAMSPSAKAGYELACKQVLAALTKGRGNERPYH